jgi:ATP-binding cassette subfamily B protein
VSGKRSLHSLRQVFPSGRLTLLLVVGSAGSGFAEAALLALVARIAFALSTGFPVRDISAGPITLQLQTDRLLTFAFVVLAVKVLLDAVVSVAAATLAARTMENRRNVAVASFIRASWPVQSLERDGFLQELATTHATRAANATVQATHGLASLLTFLALLLSAVVVNPLGASLIVVIASMLFVILRPLSRTGRRFSLGQRRANHDYVALVAEASTMTNEIHAFGVADPVLEEIQRRTASFAASYRKSALVSRVLPMLYQSMALLLILIALATLYQLEVYGMGSLSVVVLLLVRALLYTGQLQTAYHAIIELGPYSEELASRVELYQSSARAWGEDRPSSIASVEFDAVTFAYPDHDPVLVDISFAVGHGEVVGIVGPSGAGKSTLIQLLLRLREPSAGAFTVNGAPAAEIDSAAWTRLVAYVPQESRLIEGTAAENIRYYRDISDADVAAAAAHAQIHDDIVSWADGYDTHLGASGRSLSGGQTQRMCLARALATKPEMLVLDEPTSALDVHSESLVQEALLSMKGSVTMFIVAHRMSTLSICDRILVLDEGRVEAFAPAQELMEGTSYFSSATNLSRYGLAVERDGPTT